MLFLGQNAKDIAVPLHLPHLLRYRTLQYISRFDVKMLWLMHTDQRFGGYGSIDGSTKGISRVKLKEKKDRDEGRRRRRIVKVE
jgi:hypothetical protein